MTELIKIKESEGKQVVSAKELYLFLEVRRDFSNWCKQMFAYGFEQDRDFTPILAKSTGGRPSVDYAFTLSCAKEIAMLQRSEKGKQARQYFVDCEERLKKLTQKPLSIEEIIIAQCQEMIECKKRFASIEATQEEHSKKLHLLEAKTTTRPDYFTIAAFARWNEIKINDNQSKFLGRMAASLCRRLGHPIGKVPDGRFGYVYSYPNSILQETFQKNGLYQNERLKHFN